MTAHTFTILFVFALFASVLLQLWLALRQINHVRRHRNAVPAEFAERITLESHQRAASYTIAKTRFGMIGTLVEAIILLGFTLGGGIEWLTTLSTHWFSSPILAGVSMIALLAVINTLLTLPISWLSTFRIEAAYGFNQSTPALWAADLLKTAAVAAVIGVPLLGAVLWLMERMGANWWLYVWATWLAFSLLLMWIFPTWIAPIFNKFEPLPDEGLRARIENLLQRCGFTASGIFMMDGSKRSSHGNAYFTGLGKTKRIVFFDTLLKQLDGDEIEAVLAHELGHFKHRHIVKRMAWTFALMLGLLWLLGQLIHESWFYQGLGVHTQTTANALTLFFMVMPVFTFLFGPVGSILSRKHEYEADAYAASQSSAGDLIQALVKLYRDNAATLTPDPLHSMFYDSHPPAALRIAALQRLA
ncbi:STE24 endopeptidase [Andreprevotia lacus DSM 23236]|jgi:STE24 endopeptidase|uniref:STE24 endopeptidase n=1 Tax=Andreprevotia lacus DSM 23236 TaxID=1121001 RepID=A0A1W1XF10_9NEIS|nr:M48 family metallopeptidase [Andreprevotia lacus]SMC22208.1 STE24 endopeptidase [Andreprevotia lacus DSM 23236]